MAVDCEALHTVIKGFRRQYHQHPRPSLRPRPLRHDIVIFDELGLDLGLDVTSWTPRTNGQHNNTCLHNDSRS